MHEDQQKDARSLDDSTRVRALPHIEGFRVEKPLGKGAMGQVFLATDVNLGRKVAIKMMTAELSNDAEFRTRFENEAKTVAGFRHRNIVSVHASGEVDGFKYIVMECAGGDALADRLASGPLPEPHAAYIARQLADALRYSHARGVIHRDFKPGNILFTDDDIPLLSDFGVARSMARDRTVLTKVGMAIGAPAYMAPEQRLGEDVTERIDIYSFGLVLYQMCMGVLPEETNRVIRSKHHEVKLRAALEGISKPVVDLICRCLQWDPAKRPSADECFRALESAAWTKPSAGAESRRRKYVTAAGAALVVLAVAGLAGLAWRQGSFADQQYEPRSTSSKSIALPSLAEHYRFMEAIEAPQLTPASFRGISDTFFRTALELKQWRLSGQTDKLQERVREHEALASDGDAQAALALYLAAESDTLDRDSADFVPGLEAAMDSGYALATFWYAGRLRGALPSEIVASDPRFQRYCETMRLAADQGLTDITTPYLNGECQRPDRRL
ncbi:MAG TPA: serine/threonine-protein kinase [Gammaproteobacteria bacterium]|nr:serine/threonine-protein kinase [Gammaproteobacteria bacterium]